MCVNAEISLGTYIVGVLGAAVLYWRVRRAEALFYFWVVQMQLVEFFLWQNQPCIEGVNVNRANVEVRGTFVTSFVTRMVLFAWRRAFGLVAMGFLPANATRLMSDGQTPDLFSGLKLFH
jgi:hypothetical protein